MPTGELDPDTWRQRRTSFGSVATRSYVATMDDPRREGFLDGGRAVLATHPDTRGRDVVDLPYRTDAYRLTPA